ncbi:hypothetical protein PRIPAC_84872, partial [Pristionchus pacificus]|uniref:Meiotic nuclear division protein 1 homolog n=1 Tax=Pristionchus pacificus TaxID=54126 RepID=A0A8R1V7K4_PRIPA
YRRSSTFYRLMAARKKGLSADEKRKRMLDLFYERREFFQLKELEKIAPKEKGVISQSVKEVTQLLVDEGFVECEKIGTFVCYWAFPTKASQMRQKRLDDLSNKIEDVKKKIEEGREQLKQEAMGKETDNERDKLKTELEEVKQVQLNLQNDLKALQKYDPESLKESRKRSIKHVEDANRWTGVQIYYDCYKSRAECELEQYLLVHKMVQKKVQYGRESASEAVRNSG